MISDVRKIWYYAIGITLLTVATAYLIGMASIGTEWQMPACLTLAAILAIVPPLMLALPEPFGMVAVIGFLNGMIPGGLRPGESVEVALKKVFHALAYAALANSFMLLFFGTWDFGPYPGAAKIILVAAMVLTCWAAVHKEGEWFKKISLYYPAVVIVVCLVATLIPGIVPGKAERALKHANQALVDTQNEVAKRQLDEIMSHIKALEAEDDPKNVHFIEEDTKKIEWIKQNLTRQGIVKELFTDPARQPISSWIVAIAVIFAVFWILKKYPGITNMFGMIFLVAIIFLAALMAYREWDSVQKFGRDGLAFANKEVVFETTLTDFQGKEVSVPELGNGYYSVEIQTRIPQYSATCQKGGGLLFVNPTSLDGFGNITINGKGTDPARNGESLLIKDGGGTVTVNFTYPPAQQAAVRNCGARIIESGGIRAIFYLRPK